MPGIVYVLINQVMPGLIKIGKTFGSIEERIRTLDNTSVPLPFECFYAAQVDDPDRLERALHEAFGDHRIRQNREFFRLSPDKPKAIITLHERSNVTPGHDIVNEPGDQEALNVARSRRSGFRFSMVGINPGAELQSVFDDQITCVVKDSRWVTFRGEEHSLSSAALIVAHEKGLEWTTIAGPAYWKHNGKTLTELRDEMSEEEED